MTRHHIKFERERHWVSQLAPNIGLSIEEVVDPLVIYNKREIGVDVIVTHSKQRTGIQITELDGAEGISGVGQGRLRGDEKKSSSVNPVYGMFGGNAPDLAIGSRFKAKVNKSKLYTFSEVHEVWLFVVANLPDVPGSTFVPGNLVTTDVLNRVSATELAGSKYQRAFYQQIMFPALFEWTQAHEWRRIELP
jgi:hypothetical protein